MGTTAREDIDVVFMPIILPMDRARPIPVAGCVRTFEVDVIYLILNGNATGRWFSDREQPRPDNE